MKTTRSATYILPLLFALLFVAPASFSQCFFTFIPWGSGTVPTPGNSATLETCSFIGDYTTANGIVVGNQYSVTVNYTPFPLPGNLPINPYVVVYDATFTPIAFGFSPVVFTALTPGPYYTIPFADAFCTAFDPNPNFGCNVTVWTNTTPIPPPPNDLPCNAIPLTPAATCNYTTYTNSNATGAPGVPAPGCAGYSGGDVWFSVVVPASGNVLIDTQTGVILDGGMAVYSGTCGSLTLIECDDDDSPNGAMPSINITGGTPGDSLFVRVWEVGNNNNGTFGICAVESSTCGTPLTDDFCESPTTLYQGPNSFGGTTSGGYTADSPGNLTASFCGSIENNSWYNFTALNTTETFNFSSVTNCLTNQGIQAAVYEVFPDANGCCSALNLLSNCYSPSTPTPGIVTATPLVVGNQYILVVDGFSGDNCDFTIANWSQNLPVELSNFYGLALTEYNAIKWETVSELNNDYFNVLRSFDGIHFDLVGKINGVGNSQELNYYQFLDADIRSGKVYYQLEQVDFNGDSEKSEIIALDRQSSIDGLIAAYPNPTTGTITTEINGNSGRNGTISVSNMNGTVVSEKTIYTVGIEKYEFDLSDYESGMYFVRYHDDNSNRTIKLIKQ